MIRKAKRSSAVNLIDSALRGLVAGSRDDATRAPVPGVAGSGAPSAAAFSRRAPLALAALATLLAITALAAILAPAGSASSPAVHPFVGSWGSFTNLRSVATDNSGHVFVLDANGTLSKFDTAGNPVDFSALATNTIALPRPASTSNKAQVAVDNSAGPTQGDIYVVRFSGVEIYGADGTDLGALTTAVGGADGGTGAPFGLCSVAVGPSGAVYTGESNNVYIERFIPLGNPANNSDYDRSLAVPPGSNPCSLAADSAGAVYDVEGDSRPGTTGNVAKYNAGQFSRGKKASGTTLPIVDAFAVAVDPGNDDLYAAGASDVAVFDSNGNSRGAFGSGNVTSPSGVAVDSAGRVFVANSTGSISVFGPALTLPDVTSGSADAVDTTSATLHGTVKTSGVTLSDCHFEIGTSTGYSLPPVPCDHADGNPIAGPVDIPADSAVHTVSADASGLDPATTYHFRLVAANTNGASPAGDAVFDTAGVPGIALTDVSRAGDTDAIVTARVNPRFAATTYHVDYGADSSYGASTPESASIGSDGVGHDVAVALTGLDSNSDYHFRFVATNSYGSFAGPDAQLTTCDKPRAGASASLPDCRSYEQVSPVDKNLNDVDPEGSASFSLSLDGSAAAFGTYSVFPDASSAPLTGAYSAVRGADSWQTIGITPGISSAESEPVIQTFELGASADFRKILFKGTSVPAPGGTAGRQNVYVYDAVTGTYQYLVTPTSGLAQVYFAGGAPDGSSMVFVGRRTPISTTPPVVNSNINNLYEWTPGGFNLVGILPNGNAAPGSIAAGPGNGDANMSYALHAVSADGSRIYWTEDASTPISRPVYLREGGQTTVVSHDQADVTQNATFRYATPTGSYALLTSTAHLTGNASAAGADLYRYDHDSGQLTDLTPDGIDVGGADVVNALGMSDDGSYVYYVATGALAAGATAGNTNIFVWHNGVTRYVGALTGATNDFTNTSAAGFAKNFANTWRVSPDGLGLGFLYKGGVAGPDPQSAHPYLQAYYYSYGDDSLTCASCPPSGAPSANVRFIGPGADAGVLLGAMSASRIVATDGGRLFFTSPDALLPADTNGKKDAYEYENGKLHLISSGRGDANSYFMAASVDGSSAFFTTRDQLVGQDQDYNIDVYAARVNGGFASQNPSAPAVPCSADACQGPPSSPPTEPNAGSSRYSGPGNSGRNRTRAKKHHKKRHHHKKKHHKKKHRKHNRHATRKGR